MAISPATIAKHAREAWEVGNAILVERANALLTENGISLVVEETTGSDIDNESNAGSPVNWAAPLSRCYNHLAKHLRLLEAHVEGFVAAEFRPWAFGPVGLDAPPLPSLVDQWAGVFSRTMGGAENEWLAGFVEPMRRFIATQRSWFDQLESQAGSVGDNEPAVMIGDGRFRIGGQTIELDGNEAIVLQALVELEAATGDTLAKHSGVTNASRVLRRIHKKYDRLRPFITLAAKKNTGGYQTTIRPA